MSDPIPITLQSLADGAAEQLFQDALGEILENIDDPNTSPDATRSITLKFEIEPDDERRVGRVGIYCSTKMPSARAVKATIHIGAHKGQRMAVEALPQGQLFPEPAGKPQAVDGGAS